jgi:hypothetical protein
VATIKPTADLNVGPSLVHKAGQLDVESAGPNEGDVSLRAAAIAAGVGLLVMAVLGFLGPMGLNALLADEDAAKTSQNIAGHELLYRLSVGSFLLVAVLDVVVAWALYLVLRPANRPVALLAGWLRIVYAGVFAAAVTNLLVGARFATDAGLRNVLGIRQADAQTLSSVDAFTDGWKLALAIFGIHLLVLGYVVARAVYMPMLLGVLVMIAGVGYLIDAVAGSVWRGYQIKLSAVAFVGEVALMVWLLWRGSRLHNSTAQGRRSPKAASTR